MATSMSITRIQRELADAAKTTDAERGIVSLESVDGRLDKLLGTIKGPQGTPYEGGTFQIDVKIPPEYPFRPPEMRFITKVWHPNVSSATGAICLDILKTNWAAAMTLRTVLISVQALLSSPVPDDPQDAIVAGQFKSNRHLFDLTARYWAHVHAHAPTTVPEMANKVAQLVAMGFNENDARDTLSWTGWDVTRASEKLAP
ncbi:ubiquitin-conjugating enzyme E2 K-like [Paramacrobiotus metropolitanus]|uniref:ubiquitin-conjugating enzyme E2 K-like n=1 Tax=Paramacrobiotus metropolitanus TaxID=2943436 RepID=UPI0024458426|nr:ubiquitin-conjugating enzyme E2 K-like [Paramacrobiotus metropolitanus]